MNFVIFKIKDRVDLIYESLSRSNISLFNKLIRKFPNLWTGEGKFKQNGNMPRTNSKTNIDLNMKTEKIEMDDLRGYKTKTNAKLTDEADGNRSAKEKCKEKKTLA